MSSLNTKNPIDAKRLGWPVVFPVLVLPNEMTPDGMRSPGARVVYGAMMESLNDDTLHLSARNAEFAKEERRAIEGAAFISGFVDMVLAENEVAIEESPNFLGYFYEVRQWLENTAKKGDNYRLSHNVMLLRETHHLMQIDRGLFYLFARNNECIWGFTELIKRLKSLSKMAVKKRELRERHRSVENSQKKLKTYVDKLSLMFPSMLVTRIDLAFSATGNSGYMTLPKAQVCLRTFLDNSRRHGTFRYRVGYIWGLFWCISKGGYYFHMISFHDAEHESDSSKISKEIAEYWTGHIAPIRGRSHDCSGNKIKGIGVGIVDRSDALKRAAINEVVIALICQSALHFSLKPIGNSIGRFRSFGCGELPKTVATYAEK